MFNNIRRICNRCGYDNTFLIPIVAEDVFACVCGRCGQLLIAPKHASEEQKKILNDMAAMTVQILDEGLIILTYI